MRQSKKDQVKKSNKYIKVRTERAKRHKVKERVVPHEDKKGTSLVQKGTSKAKKEQAIKKDKSLYKK